MKNLFFVFCLLGILQGFAQVSINNDNSTPHNSAQLEVKSTNKGVLLPRINTPTNTITTPAEGLIVYNQTDHQPAYFNGSVWNNMANGSLYQRFPNSLGYFGIVTNSTTIFTDTYSWTVPAGINKIWVELWAGGDAGGELPTTSTTTSGNSGGDGGDYLSIGLDVTAGQIIPVIIGRGGAYVSGIAQPGGNSNIQIGTNIYQVRQSEIAVYFNGSIATTLPGLLQFVAGEDGHRTDMRYDQAGTTLFYRFLLGGDGGDSYPAQKGGRGISVSYDMTDNQPSGGLISVAAKHGAAPGAGGGVSFGAGGAGGPGMVIVHW